MRGLADRGHGFPVTEEHPDVRVPIVPAAVIFDLLLGERDVPDAELGRRALDAALESGDGDGGESGAGEPTVPSGCVGAGTGAMAGALKGGVGQATVTLADGSIVSAIVVANPMGAVAGPDGRLWSDPSRGALPTSAMTSLAEHFVGLTKVPVPDGNDGAGSGATLNTTIGCVVTDASLTQDQAQRLAMAGHDGMARAIRPAHLPMDGDTLFCLATGTFRGPDALTEEDATATPAVDPAGLALLAAAAADAVEHAIVDAVTSATSRAGVPAFSELVSADRGGE